ncbi:MAG TPA: hypothetical protein VMB53_07275 [Gaiellaceae bacterium]|nr:hypothetical protein [Gaiellaceae bacterium]
MIVALAAATAAVGNAQRHNRAGRAQVVAYTRLRRSSSPGVSAGQALTAVASRLPELAAHLGSSPIGYASSASPWLYVTVPVPSMSGGADIRPFWRADLLEGAIAELSSRTSDLRDAVLGSTFSAELPDGTLVSDATGGMGDVSSGQVFASGTESDAFIRSQLVATLTAYGVTPVDIQIVHVIGASPAVVVRTADISATAPRVGQLIDDLFGTTPKFEGYYLELQGPNGTPFVRVSASFRTGAGRLWIDPSWDGQIGGLMHMGR